MKIMIWAFLQFAVGIGLLIWSAEKLVQGAVGIAEHFKLPPLIIGITLVAIGTSAPEIFISIMAIFQQAPEMAIGNAIGSNIANIGLVLGLCALVKPLVFPEKLFKTEFPLLLIISCLISFLIWDRNLSFSDGLLCLLLFIGFIIFYIVLGLQQEQIGIQPTHKTLSLPKALLWSLIGFILLPLSSDLIILSAKEIALYFKIPKLFIGLTLIALGTSLPELAASLVSTLKGHSDMAIGNIIGSNICNLTAVLAPIGLIDGNRFSAGFLASDLTYMLVLTFLLPLFYLCQKYPKIKRLEGLVLFGSYVGYLFYLTWRISN